MSNDRQKRIVIIGATSAIAEHCARLWVAREPIHLTLVARNREKAERIAADLRVRGASSVIEVEVASFVEPAAIDALVRRLAGNGPIDTALIAHGSLADQATCEQDLVACDEALVINGVSPALFAEAFARHMQHSGAGHLIVLGSVAGDRGRKSNYVYGAAKGLLDRYAQGLQHRLAHTAVRVTLVKPGPTDTPMTAHLKATGGRLADVADVAKQIVHGADRGSAVIYAPGKWALIMLVIKHLPRFVFHRMNI